jgi:hypothetical protein
MKTDELIDVLSRHTGAVAHNAAARRLALGSLLGGAAAVPLMLAMLGINPDLAADAHTWKFWVKAAFVIAIAVSAWKVVRRLARPGADPRGPARALSVPFALMAALAVVVLFSAPAADRLSLVLGSSWDTCPVNIATLALPSFVLLLAAVRSLAPTRLALAGAATGLLAGALGTLVYLLHCPELEAPFIAVWYVLGMLIPTGLGALIAPKLLVW